MRDINIPLPDHVVQLQLELAENVRERQVQFRIGEVEADAGARAASEGEEVFGQPLLLGLFLLEWLFAAVVVGVVVTDRSGGRVLVLFRVEPALRDEFSRLREDGRVVVDEHGRHGDGGVGREDVVAVLECAVRVRAFHAVGDAVAEPKTFGDDGGEVGEVFELLERCGDAGVWHGLFELGGEFGEYGRVGEDVVGHCFQRVLRRDAPGADQADRFLAEAK